MILRRGISTLALAGLMLGTYATFSHGAADREKLLDEIIETLAQ